jgi:hypothetical protein
MMRKTSTFLLLLAVGTAFFIDAADVKSQQAEFVDEATRRTKTLGKVEETSNTGKVAAINSMGNEAKANGRDLADHGGNHDNDKDEYDNENDYDNDNDKDYDNDNGNDYDNDNGNDYDNDNGNEYDKDNDEYDKNNNGYDNDAYDNNNNGYDNDAYDNNNNGHNNDAYDNNDNGHNNGYDNDGYDNDNNGYDNGYDNDAYDNDNGHGYGNPYGDSTYGVDVDCDVDRDYDNGGDYGSVSPYDISDYENKLGPYSNGYVDGYSDMYDYDCRCPCEGSEDVEYGVQVDVYDIFYGNPLPHAPCDLPVDTICVSDYRAMELIIDSPVIFQCRRFGYCLHYV